jgi:hypothetical protein
MHLLFSSGSNHVPHDRCGRLLIDTINRQKVLFDVLGCCIRCEKIHVICVIELSRTDRPINIQTFLGFGPIFRLSSSQFSSLLILGKKSNAGNILLLFLLH